MTPLPTTMRGSSSTWHSGRRVLRGLGRTLAALVGLLVVLGLVGAMYESAESGAVKTFGDTPLVVLSRG